MSNYMKRLNVGCGLNIKKDWINLDLHKLNGVDVVHDIEKVPWPFENDYFDEIECFHVLEHVEYIPILEETYRILKKNGVIRIAVPHFTSPFSFIDPTHKKLFSIRTFEFFIKDSAFKRNYYFHFAYDNMVSRKINFEKKLQYFYNYIVSPIINIHPKIMMLYEATFLRSLFPAESITVVLKK
jgi:ubiquinone/menaquinone biosynthesis C-methylase UbiE